ncbi:MAG: heavy metal translocating P-type ATPase, partial [Candidatus Saccharimonadales bacterium]
IGDGVNERRHLWRPPSALQWAAERTLPLRVLIGYCTNNLLKVATAMNVSKQVWVIKFNFRGAIVVDDIGIVLALLGLLSPVRAALIRVGSGTFFILN